MCTTAKYKLGYVRSNYFNNFFCKPFHISIIQIVIEYYCLHNPTKICAIHKTP